MIEVERNNLENYLRETLGESVRLVSISEIGSLDEQAMREFRYGKSLKVTYERDGGAADNGGMARTCIGAQLVNVYCLWSGSISTIRA